MRRFRDHLVGAWPMALLVAIVLAPLAFHWARGRTLAWFDTMALYAPQRGLVGEALRSFRLPLWNPYSAAGVPLFADAIHGVLHPISLLAAWLPERGAIDALIGGHVLLAGLGAALLARELGASRPGVILAGMTYALSGFVLSMAGNLVYLAGAGSLPLAVAGVRRVAVASSPGRLVLATGGVAVLAFTGDAQGLAVGVALGLALATEGDGWRGLLRGALASGLGLLVAGIQLVPTAWHIGRSVRSPELWMSKAGMWALEPWRLPEFVLPVPAAPEPFLDPVFQALTAAQGPAAGGRAFPFAASLFVGLVPLSLALAGLRDGRRGKVLGGLGLALLWVAFGSRFGASGLLAQLPIAGFFQYAEKYVAPLSLLVAVLGGLGLRAVQEGRVGSRWLLGAAALLFAGAVAGILALRSSVSPEIAAGAAGRWAEAAGHLAAAAVAMLAWGGVQRRLGGRTAWALVGAAGLELILATPAALRPGDPVLRLEAVGPIGHPEPPGPRFVPPAGIVRREVGPGEDPIGAAGRDFAVVQAPAYNVRSRVDSLSEYSALSPLRFTLVSTAFAGERWPAVARRYGATHVFLTPGLAESDPLAFRDDTAGGLREPTDPGANDLWAVPHRPWASFAPEVRLATDLDDALAKTREVVDEGSAAAVVESRELPPVAPGRVLAVERGLESLRVEAESIGDGTLLIADAWWPGWVATIDAREVTILPADVLIRAVPWPSGRHLLEMRYRPPEVAWGLGLTLLGLLATGLWGAHLARVQRRPRNPGTRPTA